MRKSLPQRNRNRKENKIENKEIKVEQIKNRNKETKKRHLDTLKDKIQDKPRENNIFSEMMNIERRIELENLIEHRRKCKKEREKTS